MKKKVFALGMAGLTVASMGAAAAMPMMYKDSVELQDAISSADYDEFITELEQINPEMAEHMSEFRFERMIEKNDRMQAIEDNDYDAWIATFPENSRYQPTEEDFDEILARHKAHEAVEDAIEDNDYDAWLNAVGNLPYSDKMAEIVSEEEFSLLVQMHKAREEGDFEGADEIAEELGLGFSRGSGLGKHQRLLNGQDNFEEKSQGMHGGKGGMSSSFNQ